MPNPTQQMRDMIDTYYEYVKGRIVNGDPAGSGLPPINPERQFGGIIQAEAWPPTDIILGGLYLTILQMTPNIRFGTRGNPYYTVVSQWLWANQGTDLTATQQGANRGNRFPDDVAIRNELLQANFPLFTALNSISVDPVSGDIIMTPYSPTQVCRWTALAFGPKTSGTDDSGVLYGAAAVDVSTFQQPLTQ